MLLKVCLDINVLNIGKFILYRADVLEIFDHLTDDFLKDNFLPEKLKLFNQDIFEYKSDSKTISIYSSDTRNSHHLPGILKLDKTYGKYKKKLLYKCIPDDKRLPSFLIPYKIPSNFSKANYPLYVLFKYLNWDNQHPYGEIKQNLGSINNLPNFYEYILYCKSLQISNSKFNKLTNKALENKSHEKWIENIVSSHPSIEDRTKGYFIFSIDGETTSDYDDAISFQNGVLSIYISNVAVWLDILDLWDAFSKRVSTIYLPNHKRNMLPNILSDDLCSLIKKRDKIAMTMDVHLNFDENNNVKSINKIEFKNCLINLRENFVYDSEKLLKNKHFNNIDNIVKQMNQNVLFIHNIRNSCDIISYLMIFMNYQTSLILKEKKIGIFRKLDQQYDESKYKDIKISEQDKQFLFFYHSNCAQYCKFDEANYHTFMYKSIKQYTHITSPIRRLVDLLNSIVLQNAINIWDFNKSTKAISFYEKWFNDLDYINLMMRSIRKVQNNCSIFNKIEEYNKNNKRLVCKGLCFDGMERNNKMTMFNVYIRELGYIGKYSISNDMIEKNNIKDFHYYNFEIYLFLNEENFKKKVKIKYIES